MIGQNAGKILMLRTILLSLLLSVPTSNSGAWQAPVRVSDIDLVRATLQEVRASDAMHLDIRYASKNNFMGQAMYQQPHAFVRKEIYPDLLAANREFNRQGYGLILFDAYRPWQVSLAFWNAVTPAQRRGGYVAHPKDGSRHNRACAVDVSLFRLSDGKEVSMPSAYDEMTLRAHARSASGSAEQRRMRDWLIQVMRRHRFQVLPQEWWHFDCQRWRQYPILDVPFEAL
jgi:zinc D-Ala-D-Ala dipeptidase